MKETLYFRLKDSEMRAKKLGKDVSDVQSSLEKKTCYRAYVNLLKGNLGVRVTRKDIIFG